MTRQTLVLAFGLFFSSAVHAEHFEVNHDYFGLDVGALSQPGQGAWEPLFSRNYLKFSLFYGNEINSYLGYELGYTWSNRRHQISQVAPSASLFNLTNTSSNTLTLDSQARLQGLYLDFNLRVPFKPILPDVFRDLDLLLSLGGATTNSKFKIVNNGSQAAITSALKNTQGRSYNHLRFGATFMVQVTEQTGIRLGYLWANTSRLRGKGPIASLPLYRQIYRDSHEFKMGLYYLF